MDKKSTMITLGVILGVIAFFIICINLYKYIEEYKWEKEVIASYNEIEFTMPDQFIKMDPNKFELGPQFYYRDDDTYCYASIGSYDKYEDKQWWFNNLVYVDLNDVVGEQQEVTIDGKPAMYIDVKERHGITYYYGLESTNHLYELRYTVYDYTNGDRPGIEDSPCLTARDQLINSIKLK